MTAPTIGAVVTGRCTCHAGGNVTGEVVASEVVRLTGRPVRLLQVRCAIGTHAVPSGNLTERTTP